ncbi:MAG: hypothetical protein K2Z81_03980 [Cyanobacteria bacterium]|nr:hypothetical protein [Cyanobacteriota bacterium]
MTQQNSEDKITLNHVLQLVAQLSPEEKAELRRQLDQSWNEQWDGLTTRVREKSKLLPPLSDEEIMEEVKAVREARKGKAC